MRVISGFLKGKNIIGYDILGTRPTMSRVKESLFASIYSYLQDSIVLDLFAGSGSLAFEAISNGASKAYLVDNNPKVINILRKNILNLNINDKCLVYNMDYQKALEFFNLNKIKFDLIFLDPPYKFKNISFILEYISKNKLLNDNGLAICEYQDDKLADSYLDLSLIKSKKYGDKYINIYKKEEK